MKTAKSLIAALFVLLTAQIASAYYCPSTGRWLSRDPIGEPGFENLRAANALPGVGQVVSSISLPPGRWIDRDSVSTANDPDRYAFVKNAPVNLFDPLGLRFGDGKICGNYCGGGYCGGKKLMPGENCDYSVQPTDALDSCCQKHDKCYDDVDHKRNGATKKSCDAGLCACSKIARLYTRSCDKCGSISLTTVPIWACFLTN